MKRKVLRPVAVGIATLSTVAGMVAGAVSSQAAQIGTLTFSPASGVAGVDPTVSGSAPCDAGTNYQLVIAGSGFAAGGVNVTANNPISILPINAAGGYDVPLSDTLANIAQAQTPVVTYVGDYTITGVCKNNIGAFRAGTLVGTIHFSDPNNWAFVAPAVTVTTTTALASSPASPVNTGAPVVFTAHVSGTPTTPAVAGTVQLMDGTTAVGSPTAVDASGNAVITTSFATAGSHSLTAAFTGSTSSFTNSVSTPIVYTVNLSPATPTATALSIAPAVANSTTPVTLTATVTPTAAGTVQFADGATALGAPVTVAAGTAAKTQVFAAGAHSFTATFVPANAAAFAGSVSTSQALTVTAFTGVSASETIETVINAGSLTISVADNSKVVLPSPVLNGSGTYLTTQSTDAGNRLHKVTVTDTRAGNPGWVASGQVSDFHNIAGADTTPIAGVNLGWYPGVISSSSGAVAAGPIVAPALALATNPAVPTALVGLQVSRTLATAAPGAGTGTALLDAALVLNVPTTVIAGTYDATLTLTAI